MRKTTLISSLLVLISPLAMAHPGSIGSHDFESGVMHPITGIDHVSVMIAVGMLAALFGGQARWRIPLAFVGVMVIGALTGLAGMRVPGVEVAIAGSVVIMGLMLMSGANMSKKMATGLVMIFAAFHGLAHGAEMPFNAQAAHYFAGFVLATSTLHFAGVMIGEVALYFTTNRAFVKVTGVIMALLGGSLLLS
ncbi:HupE/UreJ family protein [Vibrio mediterranei]